MMNLFFPSAQRITRKHYWFAAIGYMVVGAVVALAFKVLGFFIPNESTEPGSFSVSGVGAIPFIVISLATLAFDVVSGIKVARRRFHDRDKSGWWILIQLVPIVGQVWCFVELGLLAGTPDPNRYGPASSSDPLASTEVGYSTAV